MAFIAFISIVIIQRLFELFMARRNEEWLRKRGAVEYGQSHYPAIILLHSVFIVSLIVEFELKNAPPMNYLFLAFFLLLIMTKALVISSLGKYWNTKIFRVPGSVPVRKGLYRFVKHPNYIIVVLEMVIIPLVFNLYFTAIVFSLLNGLMLRVRIKEENRVWMM